MVFFGIGFAVMYGAYMAIPNNVLIEVVYRYLIIEPCAALINLLVPAENVAADGGLLRSSAASLVVVRGCDGAGILFLLAAALLAFSMPWPRKLLGVLYGIVLVYLLNLARIVGLYFVAAYARDWFVVLHTLIVPLMLIVIISLFFSWWINDHRTAAS